MCEGAQHVHVLALTLSPYVSFYLALKLLKKIEFQKDRQSHIYSISLFQLFLEAIRGLHCVFLLLFITITLDVLWIILYTIPKSSNMTYLVCLQSWGSQP